MATEEPRDPFKGVDWKAVGNDMQKDPGVKPGIKKRLPRKIRQIPDCYFLPRRSLPYNIAFFWIVHCWWNWCWHAFGGLDKQES